MAGKAATERETVIVHELPPPLRGQEGATPAKATLLPGPKASLSSTSSGMAVSGANGKGSGGGLTASQETLRTDVETQTLLTGDWLPLILHEEVAMEQEDKRTPRHLFQDAAHRWRMMRRSSTSSLEW